MRAACWMTYYWGLHIEWRTLILARHVQSFSLASHIQFLESYRRWHRFLLDETLFILLKLVKWSLNRYGVYGVISSFESTWTACWQQVIWTGCMNRMLATGYLEQTRDLTLIRRQANCEVDETLHLTSLNSIKRNVLVTYRYSVSFKVESTIMLLAVEGLYRVLEHSLSWNCKQLEADQSNVGLATVTRPEWGWRGHSPPLVLYTNFPTVKKDVSDWQRHWLEPPEQIGYATVWQLTSMLSFAVSHLR